MTSEERQFTADVFIAGAGPAGLACAIVRLHTANHGPTASLHTSDAPFPESRPIPYTGVISLSLD